MLYEMIGILRPGNLVEVKEVALAVGQVVLRRGGVIRSIANWGVYELPRPMSRHQMKHRAGHHFVMRYDASPRTHLAVRSTMSLEPRVIHTAHVKLGDATLDLLSRFGKVEWSAAQENAPHAATNNEVVGAVGASTGGPLLPWDDRTTASMPPRRK